MPPQAGDSIPLTKNETPVGQRTGTPEAWISHSPTVLAAGTEHGLSAPTACCGEYSRVSQTWITCGESTKLLKGQWVRWTMFSPTESLQKQPARAASTSERLAGRDAISTSAREKVSLVRWHGMPEATQFCMPACPPAHALANVSGTRTGLVVGPGQWQLPGKLWYCQHQAWPVHSPPT